MMNVTIVNLKESQINKKVISDLIWVEFELGNGVTIRVKVKPDGLEVSDTDGTLSIVPVSSNVIMVSGSHEYHL